MRLREALQAFRAARGLTEPPPGTRLFWLRMGPVSLPLPNPAQFQWHDLHHIALGYDTDLIGEMEVSAFELRTRTRTVMVFLLCLAATMLGLVWAPRRTLAAWRRAAGCRNLYGCNLEYEVVLDQTPDALKAWMLDARTLGGCCPQGLPEVAGADKARPGDG